MPKAALPATFPKALAAQLLTAIGIVPDKQEDHHGAIVAFDIVEAQTKACSIGVQVGSLTIIGTHTLSSDNSIYRISLDRLSILRPEELATFVRQMLESHGKALHMGLLLDPATNLFFGKEFAFLDTFTTEDSAFRELSHEMHLDNHALSLLHGEVWKPIVFTATNLDTPKPSVPYLKVVRSRSATGVKVHSAYLNIAQNKGIIELGLSGPRMDPVSHRGATSVKAGHSNETQQSKAVTSTIDNTAPLEIKELPDDIAFSEKPQDHVEIFLHRPKSKICSRSHSRF